MTLHDTIKLKNELAPLILKIEGVAGLGIANNKIVVFLLKENIF
jgi:hypothetical protein